MLPPDWPAKLHYEAWPAMCAELQPGWLEFMRSMQVWGVGVGCAGGGEVGSCLLSCIPHGWRAGGPCRCREPVCVRGGQMVFWG